MPGPLSNRRPSRTKTVGALRHRVTIQALTRADDGFGGRDNEAWVDVATVWADVVPVSGREAARNGGVQANATFRVTIRWRAGVAPKQRLVWVTNGNKVLNIVSAPPAVGAANSIELGCVEEV